MDREDIDRIATAVVEKIFVIVVAFGGFFTFLSWVGPSTPWWVWIPLAALVYFDCSPTSPPPFLISLLLAHGALLKPLNDCIRREVDKESSERIMRHSYDPWSQFNRSLEWYGNRLHQLKYEPLAAVAPTDFRPLHQEK
jgi:hypothetical protein